MFQDVFVSVWKSRRSFNPERGKLTSQLPIGVFSRALRQISTASSGSELASESRAQFSKSGNFESKNPRPGQPFDVTGLSAKISGLAGWALRPEHQFGDGERPFTGSISEISRETL